MGTASTFTYLKGATLAASSGHGSSLYIPRSYAFDNKGMLSVIAGYPITADITPRELGTLRKELGLPSYWGILKPKHYAAAEQVGISKQLLDKLRFARARRAGARAGEAAAPEVHGF
jgi:hypothetical protein